MYGSLLVNHIKNPSVLDGDNTLYVIGVTSNPVRYHTRYRIAREWIKHIAETPCVHLTVVEVAYGSRQFELSDDCPNDNIDLVQLRTNTDAWIKESMINAGIRRVCAKYPNAKYFAWIDTDVFFQNPQWAQEAIHQMQTYEVIQPWSDSLDLGPQGEVIQHCRSFGRQHQHGQKKHPHCNKELDEYYDYAHCGYAWCATRKFIEGMWGAGGCNGSLIDFAILGSADFHMCWSMIGMGDLTGIKAYKKSYGRKVMEWQERALKITKGEVGYVIGTISHKFHGSKKKRYYKERYKILKDCGYDPDIHLAYDEQGLINLVGNSKLDFAIHKYSLSRCEDGTENT